MRLLVMCERSRHYNSCTTNVRTDLYYTPSVQALGTPLSYLPPPSPLPASTPDRNLPPSPFVCRSFIPPVHLYSNLRKSWKRERWHNRGLIEASNSNWYTQTHSHTHGGEGGCTKCSDTDTAFSIHYNTHSFDLSFCPRKIYTSVQNLTSARMSIIFRHVCKISKLFKFTNIVSQSWTISRLWFWWGGG